MVFKLVNTTLERIHVKHPPTIEQYVDHLPTLAESTIIQYDGRWNMLLKKYRAMNLSESLPIIVGETIEAVNNKSIRQSTFRSYRAAICYGLGAIYLQIENETIDENELENGLNLQIISNLYKTLIAIAPVNYPKGAYPERTSSLKRKSFPQDFFNYLKDLNLNSDPALRASHLWDFVQANLIVGLRPSEWLNARIAYEVNDKTMLLLVKNGKNSYGRANGDERTLRLIDISEEKARFINKFYSTYQKRLHEMATQLLEEHKKFQGGVDYKSLKQSHVFGFLWENYEPSALKNAPLSNFVTKDGRPQAGLSELYFRSLQREMHGLYNRFLEDHPENTQKRVTLYSTRHQCIANAKASKVNVFEIAAFFGHSSKDTSSRHYGKAWSGWSAFNYRPSLDSLLAVKNSLEYAKKTYGYVEHTEVEVKPVVITTHNDLNLNY